jgi:hypothetical protein
MHIKARLSDALGLGFFMLPQDAPPGSDWIDRIRLGLETSDELFSLITPESSHRPWIIAEWACFWLRGKPRTPLLVGARVSQLWDPMKTSQAADLLKPASCLPLLKRLASQTGVEPAGGLFSLAKDLADELPERRQRAARDAVGEAVAAVARKLRGGTSNVQPAEVQTVVEGDRLADLLEVVAEEGASDVKRRQVAVALVGLGRLGEALTVALQIMNRAEARSVAAHLVRRMGVQLGSESAEWQFLEGILPHLRPPQRRDILSEFDRRGIAPLGGWAGAAGPDDSPGSTTQA